MADDQDWRLRVEIDEPSAFHATLRGAWHFERELDPLIADDVVLSHDDHTVFAYASTSAAIEDVRRAVEHQLAQEDRHGAVRVDHWDDPSETWLAEGEQAAPLPPVDNTIVTRTLAETSGRLVRDYFETIVADDARGRGVTLSIVEHHHLLTTQIAFTLTGPASAVNDVIETIRAQAGSLTQLESANLTPI
jgi:hypothetical protein